MAHARQVALQVLSRVAEDKAYTSHALTATLDRAAMPARDAALATELVYGTLRHQASLDVLLDRFLTRPISKLPPPIQWTLRLGAYQLTQTRIAPHGAVGETVNLVGRRFGHLRGVVNAVLRKIARELPEVASPEEHAKTSFSRLAPWQQTQLLDLLGQAEAEAFAATCEVKAPIFVRVQPLRTDAQSLVRMFAEANVHAKELPAPFTSLLELERPGKISELPGFLEGFFTVQDPAAFLAGLVADPKTTDTVLDLCAAPGGKTTHLAERMKDGGHIFAVEQHPGRASLIEGSRARLGLESIRVFVDDATDVSCLQHILSEAGRDNADVVLLDAPCSGLGTLRRHPELRDTTHDKILELAALQSSLLDSAAQQVRPGGRLVYVVCTWTQEECEEQCRAFLVRHPDFTPEAPSSALSAFVTGPYLRTWTHRDATDSFFFARFVRHSHGR